MPLALLRWPLLRRVAPWRRPGTRCATCRSRRRTRSARTRRLAALAPPGGARRRRARGSTPRRPIADRPRRRRFAPAQQRRRRRPSLPRTSRRRPPEGAATGAPGCRRTSRDSAGRPPSRCGSPSRNSRGCAIVRRGPVASPTSRRSRRRRNRDSSAAASGRGGTRTCRAASTGTRPPVPGPTWASGATRTRPPGRRPTGRWFRSGVPPTVGRLAPGRRAM